MRGFRSALVIRCPKDYRTVEATWRKLGDLIHLFSPAECANYLTNAGYASV